MPLCLGVHKAAFGQRMLWLECRLLHSHTGRHYDAKHDFYWDELFYWDEFDRSQPDKIVKPKRVGKKAEVRDILVKRGAKQSVLAQHREEQEWKFLERTVNTRPQVMQAELNLDIEPYFGEW